MFNILVENALRYSPEGGKVTVEARRNADRVEVRVVDEGTGIPAAEREWIFRKFYRAESAARDGAAGTGLGLFIAKELVNAMGGRIWVDSTEGEGSDSVAPALALKLLRVAPLKLSEEPTLVGLAASTNNSSRHSCFDA